MTPDTSATRRARFLRMAAFAAVGAGAAAVTNHLLARRAEARHPPEGRFLTVDGVRLHYREAGSGPTVVLLHGNGVASDDFVVSGLMGRLALSFRVIAIDRPGFGWSERPRGPAWTAARQAQLLARALDLLGAAPALVVGHSWGTLVAAEMALAAPEMIRGLVLMSGYYHPTPRPDAAIAGAPALPIVGDAMRHTVSPALGRLMAPLIVKQVFAPAPVSERFRERYPISMSLRPSQLRASAAESGLMGHCAAALKARLAELDTPVLILAGVADRLVSTAHQSEWLARQLPQATLVLVEGAGHMIHHTAPDTVAAAIEGMAGLPAQPEAEAEVDADLEEADEVPPVRSPAHAVSSPHP